MHKSILSYLNGFAFNDLKGRLRIYMNTKWKKYLGMAQYDVLGLDIGTSSVRLVQLTKDNDGKYAVIGASICDIQQPEGDGHISEESILKAIQKCLADSRAHSKWAICSVSGPEVAVRHFKFPPLQSIELEGAIRLEASQVCPFNVDDAVVDYQIIQNENGSVVGVFVAATNSAIKRKTRIAEKANLNCALMDVDGLALLNCLSESRKDKEKICNSAILDVGASATTLAVMGENGLPFVRTVPFAGKDIIALVAKENNVRPDVARKDIYGNSRPTIPAENLQASFVRACGKLVSDVAETLRYHSAQEKSSPVEQILVCGSFGLVKGFIDILNEQLPIKAILWNPFDTMLCSVGRQCLDVIQVNGPAMAVAAGLAMRTV